MADPVKVVLPRKQAHWGRDLVPAAAHSRDLERPALQQLVVFVDYVVAVGQGPPIDNLSPNWSLHDAQHPAFSCAATL